MSVDKSNISNICSQLGAVRKLVMIDNCFSVKFKERVLSEMCCLRGLSYPLDGFNRISETIFPNSTYTVFDNGIDTSPADNKLHARGMAVYVHYPTIDDLGDEIDDADKNVFIKLYNRSNEYFTLPLYCFFSMLGNPITDDLDMILNAVEIINNNDFKVMIEGLVLLVNKNGVTLDSAAASC